MYTLIPAVYRAWLKRAVLGILHSHICIYTHNTRSADSRFQNVSITPAALVTAPATAASTAVTKAVATAAATANSAYWHVEGSLEPYLGLR